MSLYHKYRPKTWEQVLGQDAAVKTLRTKCEGGDFPKAVMLSGPSGTGKNTLARIVRRALGCGKGNDYVELNCASFEKPLDSVRRIGHSMYSAPQNGTCRIWCLDEFQALSRAGFAQQAMLKTLEDGPDHAHFIICTTDPTKIIPTIHTRCLKVKLNPVKPEQIKALLAYVCGEEKAKISKELAERIVEVADGSPRQALMLLEAALAHDNEAGRLSVVVEDGARKDAFELVRLMLWSNGKWADAAKLLVGLTEEPEMVRRLVLACAAGELLKAGRNAGTAYLIITSFEGNIFDTGKSGLASLCRACWEVFDGRK